MEMVLGTQPTFSDLIMKPKVIDVFTFNNEYDILDIRLNVLRPYVDRFIAVQSPTTFTGKPKPIYELPAEVESFVNSEDYTPEEIELAENSPNTQGAAHWKHEFLQKERIKQALTGLNPDDVVFAGDVDEIWEMPKWLPILNTTPHKLKLRVYTYYLNNRSNEEFWGTLVARYRDIKDECLNHLRMNATKTKEYCGWHFTSMGDLQKKLDDQYTKESYNTPKIRENLAENIKNNRDFLGRDFIIQIDESEWPEYLKSTRDKYLHLLK